MTGIAIGLLVSGILIILSSAYFINRYFAEKNKLEISRQSMHSRGIKESTWKGYWMHNRHTVMAFIAFTLIIIGGGLIMASLI